MKIIDIIIESSTKYFLSFLFGLLILLIGAIYQDILPILYPEVIQKLPKEVFLKITTLAILLFVLSSVLSFIFYIKLKNKLIPKFGVLWDKNKETYCPACRIPLSHYVTWKSDNPKDIGMKAFECTRCDKRIFLAHNGDVIELDDARNML
jgi:hypothetical protein